MNLNYNLIAKIINNNTLKVILNLKIMNKKKTLKKIIPNKIKINNNHKLVIFYMQLITIIWIVMF